MGRGNLGDLGADRSIILKFIFRKRIYDTD
jgi:hypothetical protein